MENQISEIYNLIINSHGQRAHKARCLSNKNRLECFIIVIKSKNTAILPNFSIFGRHQTECARDVNLQ